MAEVIVQESEHNLAVKSLNKFTTMLDDIVSELKKIIPNDDKKPIYWIEHVLKTATELDNLTYFGIYQKVGFLNKRTIAYIDAAIPMIHNGDEEYVFGEHTDLESAEIKVYDPQAIAPIEKITSKYAGEFKKDIKIIKQF